MAGEKKSGMERKGNKGEAENLEKYKATSRPSISRYITKRRSRIRWEAIQKRRDSTGEGRGGIVESPPDFYLSLSPGCGEIVALKQHPRDKRKGEKKVGKIKCVGEERRGNDNKRKPPFHKVIPLEGWSSRTKKKSLLTIISRVRNL